MIFFKILNQSMIVLNIDKLCYVHCFIEIVAAVFLSHFCFNLNNKEHTSISDFPYPFSLRIREYIS